MFNQKMNNPNAQSYNKYLDSIDFKNIDFYQLHIPKTGGTHLGVFLEKNIIRILKAHNVKICDGGHYGGHFGWRAVSENTFIISTLRDPVKRTVSHFAYLTYVDDLINHEVIVKPTIFNRHLRNVEIQMKHVQDLDPDEFMEWLNRNSEVLANYQLKNMFYDKTDTYLPNFLRGTTAQLSLTNFTVEKAINNLPRINILLKTESMNNEIMIKSAEKILDHFNIKNAKTKYWKPRQTINLHKPSKILFDKLPKSYIEEIEKLNKEEIEIYNTDSYFTKFDNTPQ